MYYIEITLLSTPEIPLHYLWEKMFYKVHLQLVEMQEEEKTVPIGLAFPEYALNPIGLGTKLRIFAREREALERFSVKSVFSIFSGYIHMTDIREVPNHMNYARYERHQVDNSVESLAKRRAKRENISYEEALHKYEAHSRKNTVLPFIKIKSESSNKRFSLFIKKENVSASDDFKFNTYGLSKTSSVPEF